MHINIKKLNPLTLPLYGSHLIEASAGTGKSYTLIIIYIRLILGLEHKTSFFKPLNVKEILVVTFTKSVVEELRNKIKEKINELKIACIYGYSDDLTLSKLLTQIQDIKLAITRLSVAEQEIHQAAIYTIHSFCQHIITQYPLETKTLFHFSLLTNETNIYREICNNFWRRYYYTLPIEIIEIINSYWTNPEEMMNDISPYLQGELPIISYSFYEKNIDILQHHKNIIKYIEKIKEKWLLSQDIIHMIINHQKNNYHKYDDKKMTKCLKIINQWANEKTTNYTIPKELKIFKISKLKKNIKNNQNIIKNELFYLLENLLSHTPSLKSYILVKAIKEIRKVALQKKKIQAEIGLNDLIDLVKNALSEKKNNKLTQLIRRQYPIALIDEFQDTNAQQYCIFNTLYGDIHLKNGLILMGDPKQAIYNFRDADIFTYMQAKNKIKSHYILNINWRSSTNMTNAINTLFQSKTLPFIFKEIPFYPTQSTPYNNQLKFIIKKQTQPAMCLWLYSKNVIKISEYKKIMAKQCAITLTKLIYNTQQNDVWLKNKKQCRLLKTSDIAIIVRDHNEASIIRHYLSKYKIPSIYFSNQNSIFETLEAQELLSLLHAITIIKEKKNILNVILANPLLKFNAKIIDKINKNKNLQGKMIEKFIDYHIYWKRHGILPMLYKIIKKHTIIENTSILKHKERQLINLIHLGELLQTSSSKLNNDEYKLLRWLKSQIKKPDPHDINQQIRLDNDKKSIKIITIHKSKGLEFPLVFLPFAATFYQTKYLLFHDRKTYKKYLDLDKNPKNSILTEEERLSEDMRLLYVAITRAIYQCYIGIGTIIRGRKSKIDNTHDLHLSAIGHLIQQGISGDAIFLQKKINSLINHSNGDIILYPIEKNLKNLPTLQQQNKNNIIIQTKKYNYINIKNKIRQITSYTDLKKPNTNDFINQDITSQQNKIQNNDIQNKMLTPHNFPRGPLSGIFFHKIFSNLNFNKNINTAWLQSQMRKHNINDKWLPSIIKWIKYILHVPLKSDKLKLANLTNDNKQTELKFIFPINTITQLQNIDQICKIYDPLSKRCNYLALPHIKGMLTGSIDLVFRWKQNYYILDYKSNWLGKSNLNYSLTKMEEEIILHRYELQYQIYTLALHKFLYQRLPNYKYQKNFGGVFFLFIRGIDTKTSKNGIYFCKPKKELIYRLNQMFIEKI